MLIPTTGIEMRQIFELTVSSGPNVGLLFPVTRGQKGVRKDYRIGTTPGQSCILAHFILPDRSRLSTVWQLVVRYTRSGCLLVPGTQSLTLIQRKTEITTAGTNPNPEL